MTLMQLLNLRCDFESHTRDYNMPVTGSCINTLEWFVENGHRSNSLRNGFSYAKEIAEKIITEDTEWQKKQKQSMLQQLQGQI
jgi:hypothetical protein